MGGESHHFSLISPHRQLRFLYPFIHMNKYSKSYMHEVTQKAKLMVVKFCGQVCVIGSSLWITDGLLENQ